MKTTLKVVGVIVALFLAVLVGAELDPYGVNNYWSNVATDLSEQLDRSEERVAIAEGRSLHAEALSDELGAELRQLKAELEQRDQMLDEHRTTLAELETTFRKAAETAAAVRSRVIRVEGSYGPPSYTTVPETMVKW